jgi:uncharacterized repeat protein (TIGR03806 family)
MHCGLWLLAVLAACGGPPAVVLHPPSQPPARLSSWGVAGAEKGHFAIHPDAVPYVLNTPLFSDYALKLRAVWMPPGTAAAYRDDGPLAFPVGTVISKTFYYEADPVPTAAGTWIVQRVSTAPPAVIRELDLARYRLVETRLLVRYDDGWHAYPYLWDATQDDAFLAVAGGLQSIRFADAPERFVYVVPDANQCAGCHVTDHSSGRLQPIGPRAWQLNRDLEAGSGLANQLDQWVADGHLGGAPTAFPAGVDWTSPDATLEARARAYLDSNCAHCHNHRGAADTSGLDLRVSVLPGRALGICKPPVAVGRGSGNRPWDIAPGRPDDSILLFRLAHTDPAIAMPELGRSTVHREALSLLSDWIASLPGNC